jgi:acetyl esterase
MQFNIGYDAMSLHPASQKLIDSAARSRRPSFPEIGAVRARQEYANGVRLLDLQPVELPVVIDGFIHCDDSTLINDPQAQQKQSSFPPIAYRLYCNHGLSWANPTPVLLYFHGGGFTVGSIATHDSFCRNVAHLSGVAIISIEYRLAPEHTFPAAVDDCFAAQRWLFANALTMGLDVNRIAIGGDSAGGTLAAACTLQARNEALKLHSQWLIYPGLGSKQDTPSHHTFAKGYLLDAATIQWFFGHYLREDVDRNDWRFSPQLAHSLDNLPPTWIGLAQYDPVFDDGHLYHQRLLASGVHSKHHVFEGLLHGFMQHGGFNAAAKQAQNIFANELAIALEA